jgi:two-component system KDP operon response regulator KdpE
VAALDAGADDYVTKPFGIDELLARIRAVARRAATPDGTGSPAVDIGPWRVDLADRRVTGGDGTGGEVKLTPTEWKLLEAFVRHPGKLIGQRQLLTEVWGPAATGDTSSLRLYLNRLRRKLEPDPSRPKHLLTEPGLGYRFQP